MKNNKIIAILLITACLSALSYFGAKTLQKTTKKTAMDGAKVPDFEVNNGFSKKNLRPNTPSVFIAFHPECEHCQYEAQTIYERYEELKDVDIVFFTYAGDSTASAFKQQYNLDKLENVHLIADTKNSMLQAFGVKTIPSIFIYNKEGILTKHYKGETKIEAILKAVAL